LVIWLASHAAREGRPPPHPLAIAAIGLGGLLSWTLSEYLSHRFVYHVWDSFLSQGHGLHHDDPRALIGVPWPLTTAVLVAVFFLVTTVASPAVTGLFMAGNWTGYVIYCLAHHGSHHWRLNSRWFRRMRRHHLIHHAHPAFNWGFTTGFWDRRFGTHHDGRRKKGRIQG
jgi:hypothetical protein